MNDDAKERGRPLGAVLAGGLGRRIGGGKAIVPINGRPMVSYAIDALLEARLDAVVVAKPETELPGLVVPVWREPAQPRHPLCGIVTALERGGRPIVCCGCDTPLVTAELLRFLAELPDPVAVPETLAGLQPLVGRYSQAVLEPLRDALERERPLRETVAALGPRKVGVPELGRFGDPERMLVNVNSAADVALAERLLNPPPGSPPRL